jgi:hypothetical protein
MVNQDINLLQAEEISSQEKKRNHLLKLGTIFLIIFYCLAVLAIFSFGLVVQKEHQVVSDKIKSQKIQLASLEDVESTQFLLKQRLSSLAKIVKMDRPLAAEWLNYFDNFASDGLSLEEVSWSPTGQVTLAGMAGNALYLTDFLDHLKKETASGKLAQSILISATRHPEGTYDFSLEVAVREVNEEH